MLRFYLKLLLEKWWLFVLLEVILMAGAAFYALRQPLRYATASVLALNPVVVNPLVPFQPQGNGYNSVEKLVANYNIAIKTNRFVTTLDGLLSFKINPDELRGSYGGSLAPDTLFYFMNASGDTPAHAQEIANKAATLFLAQDAQLQLVPTSNDLSKLSPTDQAQVLQLQADIKTLHQKIDALYAASQKDWSELNATLDTLNRKNRLLLNLLQPTRYNTVVNPQLALPSAENSNTLAEADHSGMLIDPARLPTSPYNDGLLRNLGIAFGLGFLLYNLGMLGLYAFQPTVRTVEQLEGLVAHNTLAVIPAFHKAAKTASTALIMRDETNSPVETEVYRTLRTNLLFSGLSLAEPSSLRTILITSSLPQEGKTTTAANLANALALAEKKVILVDADLRKPSLHSLYDLSNERGLAEVLLDPTLTEESLQSTQLPHLRILTSGAVPLDPAALLGGSAIEEVLTHLQTLADIVVLDTPPAALATDAIGLAPRADGVILVVAYNRTNNRLIRQTVAEISRVGGQIIGTVLNKADSASNSYYYSKSYGPSAKD